MLHRQMHRTGLFRAAALLVSGILLAIFLVAKIPSSKCHCRDPIKSQKELCPFGVLRSLAVVRIETPLQLALPQLVVRGIDTFSPPVLHSFELVIQASARDPPLG